MRQIYQIGGLLFVMFPKRNQIWIFNEFLYIGCLTFPEAIQVMNRIKEGEQ
jgi:hypothetical protein